MALAEQLLASGMGIAGSAFFVSGMSSSLDPMFIDDRSYRASMNTVNRGGIVQTRPGYTNLLEYPAGKLQGAHYFKPIGAAPHIVTAVGGALHAAKAPFSSSEAIAGIQMFQGAKHVYFEVATKSVQREDDGSLTAIEPKKVLIVQDGGYTRAAYWDGSTARHLDPSSAASLLATVTDGAVTAIEVIGPGSGFTTAPTIVIDEPPTGVGASRATAEAVLNGEGIYFVRITSGGSGYTAGAPTVTVVGSAQKDEVPLGGPMAWSGDRLWVARNDRLYAGDISDPISFTESTYAAEGGFFQLPEPIVALAEIPALTSPQLLVFTQNQTWIFQSGIRDRSLWKSTAYFQRLLFPDIGAASHRAVTSLHGLVWWFSMTGLTNMNTAAQASVSSELAPKDSEMAVSKGNISHNVDSIALSAFENYLLCSVPSGDKFNRHTWVLDGSPATTLTSDAAPAWNSYWTGTRPVEWVTGVVEGVKRIFHVSVDYDGTSRLWEAFGADRLDNTLAITSYVETKTHIDFNPKATGLDLKKFAFAELHFSEMVGNVSAAVYWAGTHGRYKRLASYNFVASEGAWGATPYVVGTSVPSYLPQSRIVRTPTIVPATSTCSTGVESTRLDALDIGFSLLIVWSGRAALRAYRIFANPEQEIGEGGSKTLTTEIGPKVVVGTLCG